MTKFFEGSLVVFTLAIGCAGIASAADISGTITTTLTITDNSRLVGDVTCTVTAAPCISFGTSGLTLDLNGYRVTGLADPQMTCSSGPTAFAPPAVEDGIDLGAQANATVVGPGIVQLFRGPGIFSLMASNVTVTSVTAANNCMSGILVGGGSNHNIRYASREPLFHGGPAYGIFEACGKRGGSTGAS